MQESDVESIHQQTVENFNKVRSHWAYLCKPLVKEDYVLQTAAGASPPKWHMAHTTWFFEQFILNNYFRGYQVYHPDYHFLFNSYYNSAGDFIDRHVRGMISRPTIDEVNSYRAYVDEHMNSLLNQLDDHPFEEIHPLLQLGINHEQQHQELFLMDIKNIFYQNPIRPVYQEIDYSHSQPVPFDWIESEAGMITIGYNGDGFCYDNEQPAHKTYIHACKMANRLILNGEYLEFMEAGGYTDSRYWLSDGWDTINQNNWQAPLYWDKTEADWEIFTLGGTRKLNENEPVCHLSYYEADAFARWKGVRLPTEFEWERYAANSKIEGNFMDNGGYHPKTPMQNGSQVLHLFGDLWEWTQSPYSGYPGYESLADGVGEYNGKFMCNQFVLRGGCCATPKNHIRKTYRNFYYPHDRWAFTGLRLAKNIK
ncbi:MAG: ergothioneine biosynthesis protein EgtB [Balneolales bacterium]